MIIAVAISLTLASSHLTKFNSDKATFVGIVSPISGATVVSRKDFGGDSKKDSDFESVSFNVLGNNSWTNLPTINVLTKHSSGRASQNASICFERRKYLLLGTKGNVQFAPDEFTPEFVVPTDASELAPGNTPLEVFKNTRLSSMAIMGDAAGQDAAYFELALNRRQISPELLKQKLSQNSRRPADIASLVGVTALERYLGLPNSSQHLFQALQKWVVSSQALPEGVETALQRVIFEESKVTADQVAALSEQAKGVSKKLLILKRSPLPLTTVSGVQTYQRLLSTPNKSMTSFILSRLAQMTHRSDLEVPPVSGIEVPQEWQTLIKKWQSFEPEQILAMIRS